MSKTRVLTEAIDKLRYVQDNIHTFKQTATRLATKSAIRNCIEWLIELRNQGIKEVEDEKRRVADQNLFSDKKNI